MATYLRAPTVERLPVILEELHAGSLRIPPFQRDFEWTGDQRLALFDSILKSLPTGSLMVWRTTHKLKAENPLGPYPLTFTEEASQYLLDGRQRMTTLYAALAASFWTRDGKAAPPLIDMRAPDTTPWPVHFDLDEQAFAFDEPIDWGGDNSQLSLLPAETNRRLPLAVLLDDAAYDDWRGKAKLSREHVLRARNLRSAFIDYLIPVVPLATDEIGVVTLTFKRVNSGGTQMGDADMTRALAWSEGYDLRVQIDAVREKLSPYGWGKLENDTILKAIAGIALPDPTAMDAEELAKKLKVDSRLVQVAGERVARAASILGERLGIRGPASLPYIQILVFAARVIHRAGGSLTDEQEVSLAAWAAEACLDERFSVTAAHMLRAYFRSLEHRLGLGDEPASSPTSVRPRNATECWKFRMIWARSRGTALVLAAQGPGDADGRPIADPFSLVASENENVGMLLARGGEGLPPRVRDQLRNAQFGMALQSPANRIICAPQALPSLRARLFDPSCAAQLLEGHLVTPEAHRALCAGDLASFFELRRTSIIEAEERWVKQRGGEVSIVRDQRSYAQG